MIYLMLSKSLFSLPFFCFVKHSSGLCLRYSMQSLQQSSKKEQLFAFFLLLIGCACVRAREETRTIVRVTPGSPTPTPNPEQKKGRARRLDPIPTRTIYHPVSSSSSTQSLACQSSVWSSPKSLYPRQIPSK